MTLTSKQRAYLKGLANSIDTILHVGKNGITQEVLHQADTALTARELIKGRVLENSMMTSREAAEEIASGTDSVVVQVVGSKFVLYRENKKDPKIKI